MPNLVAISQATAKINRGGGIRPPPPGIECFKSPRSDRVKAGSSVSNQNEQDSEVEFVKEVKPDQSASKPSLVAQMKAAGEREKQRAKKHRCKTCDKVFKRLYNLKNHIKSVHATPTKSACPYECKHVQCDKKYATRDRLQEHVRRVHLGTHQKHTCPYCHKGFERKNRKEKHILTCTLKPKQPTDDGNSTSATP